MQQYIDETILVSIRRVITHEEELVCNTVIVHYTKSCEQVVVSVDGRRLPLHGGSLVQKNLVVDIILAVF